MNYIVFLFSAAFVACSFSLMIKYIFDHDFFFIGLNAFNIIIWSSNMIEEFIKYRKSKNE